jgi:hypothetical protein
MPPIENDEPEFHAPQEHNVVQALPVEINNPSYTVKERFEQIYINSRHINTEEDPDEALFSNIQVAENILEEDDALLNAAIDDAMGHPLYQINGVPEVNRVIPYQGPAAAAILPQMLDNPDRGEEERGVVQHGEPQTGEWGRIRDLPGYRGVGGLGATLRVLGRVVFRTLPCYTGCMEPKCRAEGIDPLGEICVLMDLPGRQPDGGLIMRTANWIRQYGKRLNNTRFDFGLLMPGYKPDITLVVQGEDSYLMVEETLQNGAPRPALYIYSWSGGERFYENNPTALEVLGMNPDIQYAVRQIEQAHPVLQAPQQIQQPVVPIEQVQQNEVPLKKEENPSLINELKPAPHINSMKAFRANGFITAGSPQGPILRKNLDNGTIAIIAGEGRSLTLATRFEVKIEDNGMEIANSSEEGADAVLHWIETQSMSPKP